MTIYTAPIETKGASIQNLKMKRPSDRSYLAFHWIWKEFKEIEP
jgi:hypothetical protein